MRHSIQRGLIVFASKYFINYDEKIRKCLLRTTCLYYALNGIFFCKTIALLQRNAINNKINITAIELVIHLHEQINQGRKELSTVYHSHFTFILLVFRPGISVGSPG